MTGGTRASCLLTIWVWEIREELLARRTGGGVRSVGAVDRKRRLKYCCWFELVERILVAQAFADGFLCSTIFHLTRAASTPASMTCRHRGVCD